MTVVRAATAGDADALAALAVQLEHRGTTAADIARRLRAAGADPGGVLFVAEGAQGRVVGLARALVQHFVVDDPFVELAALVVDAADRSAGVGARLLDAVERWARDGGFGAVHVRSNVIRQRAHRFYLREGYAELKQQKVFIKRL